MPAADVDRFRDLVERFLGLHLGADADQHLERVLTGRAEATGRSVEEYLAAAERDPTAELPVLASQLTVGETYFLRHVEQFRALVRTVVPERLRTGGTAGLRLLSAGCASGEEAYSLAIALRESAAAPSATSVLGVDVNPAALEKARIGRYSDWSMRALPAAVRRRWFITDGADEVIDPSIRAQVRFERCNFAIDDLGLWRPDSYDVVFCRNVLMYFRPQLMAEVVGRIARALTPGGYLFLGSAETLRTLSTEFEICEADGAFFYRRTSGATTAAPASPRRPRSAPAPAPSTPDATPRAERLVPAAPVPRTADPTGPGGEEQLPVVLELFRRERFTEALDALESRVPSSRPDVLLLRAALQTAVGDRTSAEHTCYRVLATSTGTPTGTPTATGTATDAASAHVLLALSSEARGERRAAIDHCRTAIDLDPDAAFAHLNLAHLARRDGDPATARREFAEAAQLLPGADDLSVLVFGGGFDRPALVGLCRSQAVIP